MSLPRELQKIKGFLGFHEGQIVTIMQLLLILGVGSGAYFLGAESRSHDGEMGVAVFSPTSEALPPSSILLEELTGYQEETLPQTQIEKNFVASSKGTKYHRLDCPGAQTIKAENKIYFSTEEDARKAGFTPAGNCPELR